MLDGLPYVPRRIAESRAFGGGFEPPTQDLVTIRLKDLVRENGVRSTASQDAAVTRWKLATWCPACAYGRTANHTNECYAGVVHGCAGPKTEEDLRRYLREERQARWPALPREMPGFTADQVATLLFAAGRPVMLRAGALHRGVRRAEYYIARFDRTRARAGSPWALFLYKAAGDQTEFVVAHSYAEFEAGLHEPFVPYDVSPQASDVPDALFEIYGFVLSEPYRRSRAMYGRGTTYPLQNIVWRQRRYTDSAYLEATFVSSRGVITERTHEFHQSPDALAKFVLGADVAYRKPAEAPAHPPAARTARRLPLYMELLPKQESGE